MSKNAVDQFLLEEVTPKKCIFFVNANKNLALRLAINQRFSLFSVGFPYEICL